MTSSPSPKKEEEKVLPVAPANDAGKKDEAAKTAPSSTDKK